MRFHTFVFAMALALPLSPSSAAPPSQNGEITASRNPVAPGESVTLNWYFTGTQVTVSGGGMKNRDVTGKRSLVVYPRQTTRYTFDVRYNAKKLGADRALPTRVKYFIDLEVTSRNAAGLTPYSGVPGWKVNYLKGWKYDKAVVSSSTIVYFQKEDDSVERIAIASMPVQQLTCAELADKVKKDFYGGYDELEILSEEPLTHCGVAGTLITFSGNPNSHPGVRTQSMVMVLARDGRGYIVSARTHASKFNVRKSVLDSMLRSFSLTGTSTALRPKE